MTYKALSVIGFAFALMIGGCKTTTSPTEQPRTTQPTTQSAASSNLPVVEMWNGGIHLAGIEPFLMFAAWNDGTVLVSPTSSTRGQRPTGLLIGKAKPQDIEQLLKTADTAGFFDPPIKYPVVYPDGPDFVIILRHAGKQGRLEYHGGDPKLGEIGPTASPSRDQMRAFYELWHKVETSIKHCPVSTLSKFKGQPPPFQPYTQPSE